MIKLSIIVPIYGVEQYLHKCVESLLNQDIPSSDYEIILVDDGSPDACPQICDEYAAAHKNIRVVHRENGGLSTARNSGIKIAQGEYLMFVDSDDYIEASVLNELMKQVERDNLDVLRYNYCNVNACYEEFYPNKDPKRDVDYSESVTDGVSFLNERLGPGCYAWQFVVNRKLLNECIFKEGIYFEDVEWTPRMLVRAKRVASTSNVVYNYLWRSGSITLPTDPIKRKKVIDDKIALIRGFKEQSKKVKDPMWFVWMTSFVSMTVLDALVAFSRSERKVYISELMSLNVFPLSMAKEKRRSERIKIKIANVSPELYCKIMNIRKTL